jgi:predicted DNA-binding transcriptional regulator YafY
VTGTPARLLDLLALLQMPRAWSGTELAARLRVTTRTVRNDIERLRMLGYRIDGTRGSAGGYRLAPGTKMPPLLLDDADVIVITASLLTAQTGSVAGMQEHAQRALGKLEQVMPPALRRRADSLRGAVVQVGVDAAAPSIDPDVLALISAACRDHEILRFDYRSHQSDRSTRRIVEPHRLVNWGRHWYLFAYDTGRKHWRTFRVDRIEPNPPAGPRFTPRPPARRRRRHLCVPRRVSCGMEPPRHRHRLRAGRGPPRPGPPVRRHDRAHRRAHVHVHHRR